VRRASVLVLMFSAPAHIFDVTESVGFRFHILRNRTHFRRYRGRMVPFLCFAFPDAFSTVLRASDPFSCFALSGMFSAVQRASGLDFIFCAPGLFFGGTECIRSHFHVLCVRTHFLLYRGRRVPFSCFTQPDSFSAVTSASDFLFIFCASRLVLAVPHNST
jgi:hypothetical protein